jgi:hypothetical protein
MSSRLLPVLLLIPFLAPSATAGISNFWHRDARPSPSERVPQLLQILRSDGDEGKRAAAAEELRQFDPVAFPEIIPALLDVLHRDAKPSVRTEAVQTLGRLRPVSQLVGQALEQARDKDASMRVRVQARKELLSYHWHGYRSGKPEEGTPATKEGAPSLKEPPLAPPAPTTPDGRSVGRNATQAFPPIPLPDPSLGTDPRRIPPAAPAPTVSLPLPQQGPQLPLPQQAPPAQPTEAPARATGPALPLPPDPPARSQGPELPPLN